VNTVEANQNKWLEGGVANICFYQICMELGQLFLVTHRPRLNIRQNKMNS
jgi:hypothetical protein